MAFPSAASNPSLSMAWTLSQQKASTIRQLSVQYHAEVGTGAVYIKHLMDYGTHLKEAITVFEKTSDTTVYPGIVQYARDQVNDQTYNVVQGFLDMKNACISMKDWLLANVPVSSAVIWSPENDGTWQWAQLNLTAPQVTAVQNQMQNVIDQIRAPVA